MWQDAALITVAICGPGALTGWEMVALTFLAWEGQEVTDQAPSVYPAKVSLLELQPRGGWDEGVVQ